MKIDATTVAFLPIVRALEYDSYHVLFCKLNVNVFKLFVCIYLCIICVVKFHERVNSETMEIHNCFSLSKQSRRHIIPVAKKGGAVMDGGELLRSVQDARVQNLALICWCRLLLRKMIQRAIETAAQMN